MRFEVQTWDEDNHCVKYHLVEDAIDYEDARDFVMDLHPDQKVIAVVKKND